MLNITIKRLLQGVFVVFFVISITFILLRMIPGDPAKVMAPSASEEQRQIIRQEMGIGEPIFKQYGIYLTNLFQGDLGQSYFKGMPVSNVITLTVGKSLAMAFLAIIIALVFGLLLGVLAAVKSGTWIDRVISSLSVVFQSMPNYWLASMLILIVGVKLKLLPTMGYKGPTYLVLPAIVLALPLMSVMLKNIRSAMMESFSSDFVKAAYARGVPYRNILFKYALRNSLIPLLTILGSQMGFLVGSIIVIEYVFSFPGLGLEILNAISRRDYNLVQGTILVLTSFFIVVNMLIDIAYVYLDPRMRNM